jgi:hypothetical protein
MVLGLIRVASKGARDFRLLSFLWSVCDLQSAAMVVYGRRARATRGAALSLTGRRLAGAGHLTRDGLDFYVRHINARGGR